MRAKVLITEKDRDGTIKVATIYDDRVESIREIPAVATTSQTADGKEESR